MDLKINELKENDNSSDIDILVNTVVQNRIVRKVGIWADIGVISNIAATTATADTDDGDDDEVMLLDG